METLNLDIVHITCTCMACPTQYEGKLSDGTMFYFRFRWGWARINLSPQQTNDIFDAIGGTVIYEEQLSDGFDGLMSEKEVFNTLSKFFNFTDKTIRMNTKYKKAKNRYSIMIGAGLLYIVIFFITVFIDSKTFIGLILEITEYVASIIFIFCGASFLIDMIESHIERLKEQEQRE